MSTHHELELIDEIAGEPEHGLTLLAEGVPRIFRAGWALIVRREGAAFLPAGRELGRARDDRGRPAVAAAVARRWCSTRWCTGCPTPWSDLDTELAAAPFGPPSDAQGLVVGRPGGPAFRPSELARLSHLAGIVTTILGG